MIKKGKIICNFSKIKKFIIFILLKTVVFFVFIFTIFILLQDCRAQKNPDLGTFDIEKVRKEAIGNSSDNSNDSLKGSFASQKNVREENLGFLILRLTLYFAITIAAIFLVVWLIKKIGIAGKSKIGGGSMDILEALSLGPNKSIILVRVVDKVYLLGQTQNSINVLEIYEGQKALELISSTKGIVSMSKFKDVLNTFMERFKK